MLTEPRADNLDSRKFLFPCTTMEITSILLEPLIEESKYEVEKKRWFIFIGYVAFR